MLTLLSTFARVRIWIPNAPSDTIQVTLVETLPFDLPLRDVDLQPDPEPEPELIEPEPEPEPEIVEEPEPEPEPAPEPEPEPEQPATPEPEPEPQPAPEPELNLNIEPQLAPPADAPEPLIPDPPPAAEDALTLPEPEEEPLAPVEEAEQPLITVEEEASQEAGLEETLGDDESDGEDEIAAAEQVEEPEAEPELAEAPPEEPSGDDMFDEEPVFGRRSFIAPQVALPQVDLSGAPLPDGAAAILPGDSGVVAIFCPEQFTNADKQEECAGRREIRSGWRPGASGEDWSRATELLKRDRERGITGPTVGPAYETRRDAIDYGRVEELRDFRRTQNDVNNLPDAGDDNLNRGVEGNRPPIAPPAFEPSWTLRDRPEGISQKDLDELERRIKEDQDDN
ncbi:MAG: hypothetical protein DHS20C04_17490 [Hyphococcus sp.]|nr:MAG: hypothetical protein DHS20C04_17490 [Marinicaulis sp.]